MMLTSKQSNKKLTTKDDLVKLEKKLEEKLASKKDLEKFATRAFDMFASKNDVKTAVIESEERMTEKIDRILTAVDGITKQYQEFDVGFAMNQGAHNRFEEDIVKTNKRVTVVEKKLK